MERVLLHMIDQRLDGRSRLLTTDELQELFLGREVAAQVAGPPNLAN